MFTRINLPSLSNRLRITFCILLVASFSLYGCGDDERRSDKNKEPVLNNKHAPDANNNDDSNVSNNVYSNNSNSNNSNNSGTHNNKDAEACEVGKGQCYGAEMCIHNLCSPVSEQRFSLTIERAELAVAGNYYVEIMSSRGLHRSTGATATTAQPQWYESSTWDIRAASDYWELTLRKRNDNTGPEDVMTCELAFKSALFERRNEILCDSGSNKLWYTIELQQTPE